MSSLITNATIQIRQDTAGNWTSTNPTPAAGEWCREIDTGALKQGDGSTAWNDLEYRQQLPFTNDLTSSNITHTLPVITGFPQTEAIYWENGGANKLTLAVTDSETVGGLSAGTWLGEGEGHIFVESDGSNWQVREYEDYLIIADSGNNKDRTILKQLNGIAIVKGTLDIASLAMTQATAGLFQSSSAQTAQFGYTMAVAPTNMLATANSQNSPINAIAAPTTSSISIRFYRGNSATAGVTSKWEVNPRWRT